MHGPILGPDTPGGPYGPALMGPLQGSTLGPHAQGPSWAGPSGAPAWPGLARSVQAWPGLAKSGQAWPSLAESGQAWPSLARPGLACPQVRPSLARSGQAWPAPDPSQTVNLGSLQLRASGVKVQLSSSYYVVTSHPTSSHFVRGGPITPHLKCTRCHLP